MVCFHLRTIVALGRLQIEITFTRRSGCHTRPAMRVTFSTRHQTFKYISTSESLPILEIFKISAISMED